MRSFKPEDTWLLLQSGDHYRFSLALQMDCFSLEAVYGQGYPLGVSISGDLHSLVVVALIVSPYPCQTVLQSIFRLPNTSHKRPYALWLYFYVSMGSHPHVSCLEHKSSCIYLNIVSLLSWRMGRMDMEQMSNSGHTMKHKEKVPRHLQEKTLLKIVLAYLRPNLRIWTPISHRETEPGQWQGELLEHLMGACLKVCFISRLVVLSANKIPVA